MLGVQSDSELTVPSKPRLSEMKIVRICLSQPGEKTKKGVAQAPGLGSAEISVMGQGKRAQPSQEGFIDEADVACVEPIVQYLELATYTVRIGKVAHFFLCPGEVDFY